MDFKVGDFVKVESEPEQTRLVISNTTSGSKWKEYDDECIVIYLDKAISYVVHGLRTTYVKIKSTEQLLRRAKTNVRRAHRKKEIDNLTYIEICARLRECEQELTRIPRSNS